MSNSDYWNHLFYPLHTLMIDSYDMDPSVYMNRNNLSWVFDSFELIGIFHKIYVQAISHTLTCVGLVRENLFSGFWAM